MKLGNEWKKAKIQQLSFTGWRRERFSSMYQTFLNETKWLTKRIQHAQEEREEEMNADVGFEEDYQKVGS